jgi:hypothetical protein
MIGIAYINGKTNFPIICTINPYSLRDRLPESRQYQPHGEDSMKAAYSIAFTLLLATSGASLAQPPTAEDVTARWEKIAQTLGLDDAQTDTFLSVMNAQDTKRRSYHEEMKTKMDTLRDETISELGETLSADQLEKLKIALTPPDRGMRRF